MLDYLKFPENHKRYKLDMFFKTDCPGLACMNPVLTVKDTVIVMHNYVNITGTKYGIVALTGKENDINNRLSYRMP